MSKPSDRKSTFSNQEGAHILQSSHFPMPSLSLLQFLASCLPRSVEPQSQSRPLRTATARVGARAAARQIQTGYPSSAARRTAEQLTTTQPTSAFHNQFPSLQSASLSRFRQSSSPPESEPRRAFASCAGLCLEVEDLTAM
jgi:hypothetical protein